MRIATAAFAAFVWLLAVSCMLSPAAAQLIVGLRGPDNAAHAAERERLLQDLAASRTEADARDAESRIWLHWMLAPDLAAARLMDRALDRRRAYDFAGAVAILDDLVASAPDWAEGWNQRATVRFLQGDLEGSLADIDETLKREPKHFGALAGQALIYIQQGRNGPAQAALKQAVEIDPYLRERSLIVRPPGKDI